MPRDLLFPNNRTVRATRNQRPAEIGNNNFIVGRACPERDAERPRHPFEHRRARIFGTSIYHLTVFIYRPVGNKQSAPGPRGYAEYIERQIGIRHLTCQVNPPVANNSPPVRSHLQRSPKQWGKLAYWPNVHTVITLCYNHVDSYSILAPDNPQLPHQGSGWEERPCRLPRQQLPAGDASIGRSPDGFLTRLPVVEAPGT